MVPLIGAFSIVVLDVVLSELGSTLWLEASNIGLSAPKLEAQ